MKFDFHSKSVLDLYEHGSESQYASTISPAVLRGFFKAVNAIEAATDERDLRALHALNYEALKGKRAHQHSMRLNKQWRLILERRQDPDGTWLLILDIEDYH